MRSIRVASFASIIAMILAPGLTAHAQEKAAPPPSGIFVEAAGGGATPSTAEPAAPIQTSSGARGGGCEASGAIAPHSTASLWSPQGARVPRALRSGCRAALRFLGPL